MGRLIVLMKKALNLWRQSGTRTVFVKTLLYLRSRYYPIYRVFEDRRHLLSKIVNLLVSTLRQDGFVRALKVAILIPMMAFVRIATRYLDVAGPPPLPSPDAHGAWYAANKKPVTVVIPVYGEVDCLRKCLESIYDLPTGRDVRVVVVDDASPEKDQPGLRKLERLFPRAEFDFKDKNGGFAATCNRGIQRSSGDVVLLNSDTVCHTGWLEALQATAYSDESIGIVGAKLLYPDGLIQSAGSFRNFNHPTWFDHCFRMKPQDYGPANVPRDVTATTGACMYIKRDVIESIGLLDENFEMAFEDMDYCLRAGESGYRVRYCPDAVLTHAEGTSRGLEQGPRELRTQDYFWKKWEPWYDNREVRDETGRIRIIYVLQDTGIGGGARNIFDQLNHLQEAGFAVELYALAGPPKWFPLRVRVTTFPDYSQLTAALAEQPAIKVATWWETAERVWKASVRKGIPVNLVQDIETSYYPFDISEQNRVLASYREEFFYFTISSWNRDRLRELHRHATLMLCAIDPSIYRRMPEVVREPRTVLAVGRSHHLKNLGPTLDAMRMMNSTARLLLFGIEPQLGKLDEVHEYIEFPTDEEVAGLYNRAGVFVQTSVHEGFCLPILEAMACGCPVICSDSHGNRDFCRDGYNCLTVPPDSPSSIAQAVTKVFEDPNLVERLVSNGLETADQFGWHRRTQDLCDFFSQIANRKSYVGGEVFRST